MKNALRNRKTRSSNPRLLALDMLERWKETELDWHERVDSLAPRDRALVRQLVSGTLRWQGKIDYYLNFFLRTDSPELPLRVMNILRMAVFQLKFCDRIPDYAVVNESVKLAKTASRSRYSGLVNGVLRNLIRNWDEVSLPRADDNPGYYLAVEYSHPEWLVTRYIRRFGLDFTRSLLEANNTQAPLVLRFDGALAGRTGEIIEFRQKMEGEGLRVEVGKYLPEALVIAGNPPRPSYLPGFEEGLFYIQDEAAMLVAHLAAPNPGDLIFDLCAAPGGKTTHLARLAGKSSFIVASDLSRERIGKLRNNICRLGLANTALVAGDALWPALKEADLAICDVPCTGTGVLRRKPELRWRVNEEDLARLAELQKKILEACADTVAPGGTLIYSTCSLEPEENWGIVSYFLSRRDDFYLEPADRYLEKELVSQQGCLETFPNVHGIDGAFAARLKRKAE